MTTKSLSEMVQAVCTSNSSPKAKYTDLIKLGVSRYEAQVLSQATWFVGSTPSTFTFGVELETINCSAQLFIAEAASRGLATINHLHRYTGCHNDINQFKLVPDSSISGEKPAECVTPPLTGDTEGYRALEACCESLQAVGATVNQTCGLHVHIGAQNLSEQEYCNVFYNYQCLEGAIDRFMANSRRQNKSHWCGSLVGYPIAECSTRTSIMRALENSRYKKVNPCSYARHKTIEFRQHQGTINATKIKAWVMFLGKLVMWSRSNRLPQPITTIDEIPFITEKEKAYFKLREQQLNRAAQ